MNTAQISSERSTSESASLWYASAISALPLVVMAAYAQPSQLPADPVVSAYRQFQNPGTGADIVIHPQPEMGNLFFAIHDVYDTLLAERIQLDAASMKLLRENLWDLYE